MNQDLVKEISKLNKDIISKSMEELEASIKKLNKEYNILKFLNDCHDGREHTQVKPVEMVAPKIEKGKDKVEEHSNQEGFRKNSSMPKVLKVLKEYNEPMHFKDICTLLDITTKQQKNALIASLKFYVDKKQYIKKFAPNTFCLIDYETYPNENAIQLHKADKEGHRKLTSFADLKTIKLDDKMSEKKPYYEYPINPAMRRVL